MYGDKSEQLIDILISYLTFITGWKRKTEFLKQRFVEEREGGAFCVTTLLFAKFV